MTQPDLSSLALPDSPELPAEIQQLLSVIDVRANVLCETDEYGHPMVNGAWEDFQATLASLRSVIAKHLLTAAEAEAVFLGMPELPHQDYEVWRRGREKLRVIAGLPSPHPVPSHMSGRGSSRGEE